MKPDLTQTSYNFLITEAETGLVFSSLALQELEPVWPHMSNSERAEKIARNTRNAHLAYETIRRFRPRLSMSGMNLMHLDELTGELRSRLLQLGVRV